MGRCEDAAAGGGRPMSDAAFNAIVHAICAVPFGLYAAWHLRRAEADRIKGDVAGEIASWACAVLTAACCAAYVYLALWWLSLA